MEHVSKFLRSDLATHFQKLFGRWGEPLWCMGWMKNATKEANKDEIDQQNVGFSNKNLCSMFIEISMGKI